MNYCQYTDLPLSVRRAAPGAQTFNAMREHGFRRHVGKLCCPDREISDDKLVAGSIVSCEVCGCASLIVAVEHRRSCFLVDDEFLGWEDAISFSSSPLRKDVREEAK